MGWNSKTSDRITMAPNPNMTPTQQLVYARKKRQELLAERDPELLAAMKYNTTGFTTFVNGKEVGRGSRGIISFDSVPSFPPDDDDQNKTTIDQVKDSLLNSKKKIDNAFDRAHGKFSQITHYKRGNTELSQPKDARRLFSLKEKASIFIDLSLSKTKTLHHTFGVALARPFYFPFERPDSYDEEFYHHYRRVLDEKNNHWLDGTEKQAINQWLNDAVGDSGEQEPDLFGTITTSQLLNMKGATIDTIENIKSYYGPPPSPELKPIAPEDFEDWWSLQEQIIEDEVQLDVPLKIVPVGLGLLGFPCQPFEEGQDENAADKQIAEKKLAARKRKALRKRKDLLTHLGTIHNDIHIIKTSGDDSTYLAPGNISDYYGLPFIYPDKQAILEHQELPAKPIFDSDDDMYFGKENIFRKTRSYSPGESLILYLLSRNISLAEVVQKISTLDEYFLRAHRSRWVKDHRVPEYWELDDAALEKLEELVPRQREHWEEEGARDRFGKVYPPAWKKMKTRMVERGLARFVVKTLENHLEYRCAAPEIELDIDLI